MCSLSVDLGAVCRDHGLDAAIVARRMCRLAPMVDDGLVGIDDLHIRLTAARPAIRPRGRRRLRCLPRAVASVIPAPSERRSDRGPSTCGPLKSTVLLLILLLAASRMPSTSPAPSTGCWDRPWPSVPTASAGRLQQGSSILVGDRLATTSGSRMRLRMRDGGSVTLGGNSSMTVEAYDDGEDVGQAVLGLAKALQRRLRRHRQARSRPLHRDDADRHPGRARHRGLGRAVAGPTWR